MNVGRPRKVKPYLKGKTWYTRFYDCNGMRRNCSLKTKNRKIALLACDDIFKLYFNEEYDSCEIASSLFFNGTAVKYKKKNKEKINISKKPGVVYFLLSPHLNKVKIGVTTSDLDKRVEAIRSVCPTKVELVLSIKSNKALKLEQSLHIIFEQYRSHGEWFEYSKEIQDYVNLKSS